MRFHPFLPFWDVLMKFVAFWCILSSWDFVLFGRCEGSLWDFKLFAAQFSYVFWGRAFAYEIPCFLAIDDLMRCHMLFGCRIYVLMVWCEDGGEVDVGEVDVEAPVFWSRFFRLILLHFWPNPYATFCILLHNYLMSFPDEILMLFWAVVRFLMRFHDLTHTYSGEWLDVTWTHAIVIGGFIWGFGVGDDDATQRFWRMLAFFGLFEYFDQGSSAFLTCMFDWLWM